MSLLQKAPGFPWLRITRTLATAWTVWTRCLMDVDPATTRQKVEYGGRTIAFCAPSCKKLFLADPAAYLVA